MKPSTVLLSLVVLVASASLVVAQTQSVANQITSSSTKFGFELAFATYTPNWAHLTNRDLVVITGCGFRTYSEVACVWDFRIKTYNAFIVDDSTIICEVPILSFSDFDYGLPHVSRLDLIFDGNQRDETYYLGQFRFGPELSCSTPISPTNGIIGGGGPLIISGQGFIEPRIPSWVPTVLLDNLNCSSPQVTDTQISCIIPAGTINQNAMVTVQFLGSTLYYLHSTQSYHYGPIFTGIIPHCSFLYGGTSITLTGLNLGDPLLTSRNPDTFFQDNFNTGSFSLTSPLVEVTLRSFTSLPPAGLNSLTNELAARKQVLASSISSGGLVFISPAFNPTDPNINGLWGKQANIEVFFNQVKSRVVDNLSYKNSQGAYTDGLYTAIPVNAPFFTYGALVWSESLPGPTFSAPFNSNPIGSANNRNPKTGINQGSLDYDLTQSQFSANRLIPGLHEGGNDTLCYYGCGFSNFTNNIQAQYTSSVAGAAGTPLCYGGSYSVAQTVGGAPGGDASLDYQFVCCVAVETFCTDYSEVSPIETTRTFLQFTLPVNEVTNPTLPDVSTSAANLKLHTGPLFDTISRRGPVDSGFVSTITGRYFLRQQPAITTLTWTVTASFTTPSSFPGGAPVISMNSTTDTNIVVTLPSGAFSLQDNYDFDFSAGTNCADRPPAVARKPQHLFGPTCPSFSTSFPAITPTFGPLSGATVIAINGDGFAESGYQVINTTVAFCQGVRAGTNSLAAYNLGGTSVPSPVSRFSTNNDLPHDCLTAEEGKTLSRSKGTTTGGNNLVNQDFFTVTNRGLFDDVVTEQGGQRLWGDFFKIYVYFPETRLISSWNTNEAATTASFPVIYRGQSNSYTARLFCGNYRYGPIVASTNPCKYSMGPRINNFTVNNPVSTGSAVSIIGKGFNDPWYGNSNSSYRQNSPAPGVIPRTSNPHQISFGAILGTPISSSITDTSMQTFPLWGGTANSDVSVSAFFDTCNVTRGNPTRYTIAWGPRIDVPTANNVNIFGIKCGTSPQNNIPAPYDLWGFKPYWRTTGTPQVLDIITITGWGFDEYCSDSNIAPANAPAGRCTTPGYVSYARCIIDGIKSKSTTINFDSGTNTYFISCWVPPRPYGTRAVVGVQFGRQCTAPSPLTATNGNPGVVITEKAGVVKKTPESGWTIDEIDWTRVLIASQRLWFRPTIISIAPTLGVASGNTPVTFSGYGFAGWQDSTLVGTNSDIQCWFGHYRSGTGRVSVTQGAGTVLDTLSCNTPVDRGEFNTDVDVFLQVPSNPWNEVRDPDVEILETAVCKSTINFRYTSANQLSDPYDWKVYSPTNFHYGPTCSVSPNAGPLVHYSGDTLSGTVSITIVNPFDCIAVSQLGTGSSLTAFPQPALSSGNSFAFPVYNGSQRYVRDCIQREVIAVWNTAEIPFNNLLNSGGNDTTQNGGTLTFNQPNGTQCGSIPVSTKWPDVLVTLSSQRSISCGTFTYGPQFSGWQSQYKSTPLTTGYGWFDLGYNNLANQADHIVTIFGSFFQDPAIWLGQTQDVVCSFGSATSQGTVQNTGQLTCPVANPGGDPWNVKVNVTVTWPVSHAAGIAATNCRIVTWSFHYGPVINSNAPNCLAGARPFVQNIVNQAQTLITGKAYGCCGFNANGGNTIGFGNRNTRCAFPTNFNGGGAYNNETVTINAPAGPIDYPTGGSDTVLCYTPFNADYGNYIMGLGLLFNQTSFTNSGSNRLLTVTEQNLLLHYCYGPQTNPGVNRVRLSSLSLTGTVQTTDAATVTLSGQQYPPGGDPFWSSLNSSLCLFSHYDGSTAPGSVYRNRLVIPNAGATSTAVTCNIPVFTKLCGDNPDIVQLQFNASITSSNQQQYYFEVPFVYPTGSSVSGPTWLTNGAFKVNTPVTTIGVAVPNTASLLNVINYGPIITGIVATNLPQSTGTGEPEQFNVTTFQAWESGGLELAITINYGFDWLINAGSGDQTTANGNAICLFADRRGYAAVTGTIAYPQVQDRVYGYNSITATGVMTSIIANPGGGAITVACKVPGGWFNYQGEIRVLLGPHNDAFTNLLAPLDIAVTSGFGVTYPSTGAAYWHWVPYISEITKVWGANTGLENLIVTGGGFCAYTNVVCRFVTSSSGGLGSEAFQGDIANDNHVICQTPPNLGVTGSTVQLEFRDTRRVVIANPVSTLGNCFTFGCDASKDIVNSTLGYSFVGISGITPVEGPIYGGTTVTFTHVGLGSRNFDSLTCVFGSTQSGSPFFGSGNVTDPNQAGSTFTCVTPAQGASLQPVSVLAYYNNYGGAIGNLTTFNSGFKIPYTTVFAPLNFDFGIPEVTSITPTNGQIDTAITVTLTGNYFNGGPNPDGNGNYKCVWTPVPDPRISSTPSSYITNVFRRDAVQQQGVRTNGLISSYRLVCPAPAAGVLSQIGGPGIGFYSVEIIYAGSSTPSSNNRLFQFTQSPVVTGISGGNKNATTVTELGFGPLTITGTNLKGGNSKQYYCVWGPVSNNFQTKATLLSSQTAVTCYAPPQNLTGAGIDNVFVNVFVTIDGGLTTSTSQAQLLYVRDSRVLCDASSSLSSLLSLSLLLSALLLALC